MRGDGWTCDREGHQRAEQCRQRRRAGPSNAAQWWGLKNSRLAALATNYFVTESIPEVAAPTRQVPMSVDPDEVSTYNPAENGILVGSTKWITGTG